MMWKKLPDGLDGILPPSPWSSGEAVTQNGQNEMVLLVMLYFVHQLEMHPSTDPPDPK